jgi:hypothetical protein
VKGPWSLAGVQPGQPNINRQSCQPCNVHSFKSRAPCGLFFPQTLFCRPPRFLLDRPTGPGVVSLSVPVLLSLPSSDLRRRHYHILSIPSFHSTTPSSSTTPTATASCPLDRRTLRLLHITTHPSHTSTYTDGQPDKQLALYHPPSSIVPASKQHRSEQPHTKSFSHSLLFTPILLPLCDSRGGCSH